MDQWTNESTKLPLMDIWNKMKFQQKKRLSKKKWQMMMMMWFTLTCTVFFFYSNFLKNFFFYTKFTLLFAFIDQQNIRFLWKNSFFRLLFYSKKTFITFNELLISISLCVCVSVCFSRFQNFFSNYSPRLFKYSRFIFLKPDEWINIKHPLTRQ